MNAKLTAVVAVILSAALLTCAGSAPANQTGAAAKQPAYFTGDGGKGKSITILPPKGVGLAENQAYLPNFVANELVSNFGGFSAMTLFDRVNNQKQYDELLSGIYDDNDAAGLDLGHLASTDYMLLGDITRTTSGYALQLTVNRNSDKTTAATYSATVSVADLDNLTGVRRASLDLLQKMGVQLTEQGRAELGMAATEERVNAQTAAARGIVAQHMGNAAEAMAQFYQAAAYDPSLAEAAARANTMSASVRTGSLGTNIRNDIAWRDEWVKILADAQTALRNIPGAGRIQPPPPLQQIVVAQILAPEPHFQPAAVDYTARTAVLSVSYDVTRSLFPVPYPPEYRAAWDAYTAAYTKASTARADVYNKIVNDLNAGLDATGRNAAWKLDKLNTLSGGTPVTPRPPRSEEVTVRAVVELLNDQGRVIGNVGSALTLGRFRFGEWNTVLIQRVDNRRFDFTVKADDIGDQMSLRFTASADPAPNNIVQVMTFTELKAARPDLNLTTPAALPQPPLNLGNSEMVRINGRALQRKIDADYPNPTSVSPFYMGIYEVTQKEWRAVKGSNPSNFKGDNLPVECVSWFDAVDYCNRLSQKDGLTPAYTISGNKVTWDRNASGYRLPTVVEWEYAARGGNGSPGNYTYSGSNNVDEVAWYSRNSGSKTQNVGTKKPNGLGLYDMSGNVTEWCWDYGGMVESFQIVRGGSWYSSAEHVRSEGGDKVSPSNKSNGTGFRVVRNAL